MCCSECPASYHPECLGHSLQVHECVFREHLYGRRLCVLYCRDCMRRTSALLLLQYYGRRLFGQRRDAPELGAFSAGRLLYELRAACSLGCYSKDNNSQSRCSLNRTWRVS